jgi:hypothetical protein
VWVWDRCVVPKPDEIDSGHRARHPFGVGRGRLLGVVAVAGLAVSIVRAVFAQGTSGSGSSSPIEIGTYYLAPDGASPSYVATLTGGMNGAFACRVRTERYHDGGVDLIAVADPNRFPRQVGTPFAPEYELHFEARLRFWGDGAGTAAVRHLDGGKPPVVRLDTPRHRGPALAFGHVALDEKGEPGFGWYGDVWGWSLVNTGSRIGPLILALTTVRENARDASEPYEVHGGLDGIVPCRRCTITNGLGSRDATLHMTF